MTTADTTAVKPTRDLTVVMPFRNRRPLLAARYRDLTAALAPYTYEIIAVDDGSIDGGFTELATLAEADPRLRVVRLRRHFGQTAALAAGFDRSRGRVVVTIDADGQTDPADIPLLLERIAGGDDIVSGRRDIPRALPTRIGNRLISAVTGVRLHDYGCPLKAYRAEVVRELRLYGDLYRLAPAIASWQGVQVGEVLVRERRVPQIGPGAGLRRIAGLLIDLITVRFVLSYTARPMQGFGRIGALLLGAGGALAIYLAFVRLWAGIDIGERPLLLLTAMLALLGVQFVVLGLLAELVVRIYFEAQQKPIYTVREEIEASPSA
jgi:glycosyltransferase involved in cell wall biosynthesis